MDKHAEDREKANLKKRYGMKESGRSTKTVLLLLLGNPRKRKKKKKGKK